MKSDKTNKDFELLKKAVQMRANSVLFLKGADALDKFDRICSALSTNLKSEYIFPCFLSSVVLRSLSLEQSMKSIFVFVHMKPFKKIHDLHKLFYSLGSASDQLVERCQPFCEVSKNAIDKILSIHKDIFVDFRYLDPSKNPNLSTEDHKVLIALSKSAVSFTDELFENAKINGIPLKESIETEKKPLTQEEKKQLIERMTSPSVPLDS